ncbi:MAG: histidine kinase dimerization/phosphoacceptor domain-containing protein [Acidobacteriota bacterium]|nr:histidine kinase dimerization/phosphoacceptor domain-containing protein [Acidobacteriota bacterium]
MRHLSFSLLSALLIASPALAEKSPLLLGEAAQVRALTADGAAKAFPVHLRGVITNAVPAPDFFVQDRTAGIYVEGNRSRAYRHRVGDVIELDGTTGPGRFAPVVRETSSRVVGTSPLPKTRLYSYSELAHGQFDSQWVQIRGIIRSVSLDKQSWHEPTLAMTVSSGTGQFRVRIPVNGTEDFSSWVGNEALISGVSGSLYNAERQFVGLLLYVPRLSFIQLEESVNNVAAIDLLRFSPQQHSGSRVRVQGVVSYQDPGNALFLLDRGKGLRVLTQQDSPVSPGDVVDVVGFPATGESAPVLEDAIFTRVRRQEPPVAVAFNSAMNWERFDGALVELDAKLLHYERRADRPSLLLQHAGIVFGATLPSGPPSSKVLSIPISSDLHLTGICLVRNGGIWGVPQSFRLLLRSDRDLTILQKPSWWNPRHAAWLLEIMRGVLCAVLAWTMLLRRRVREQMEVIRQKLRSGAVLEERNRIARELHDTLEQDLAGITIHLDLAADRFDQDPELHSKRLRRPDG